MAFWPPPSASWPLTVAALPLEKSYQKPPGVWDLWSGILITLFIQTAYIKSFCLFSTCLCTEVSTWVFILITQQYTSKCTSVSRDKKKKKNYLTSSTKTLGLYYFQWLHVELKRWGLCERWKTCKKIWKHTVPQSALHTNYTQSHACGHACGHKRNALSVTVSWHRSVTPKAPPSKVRHFQPWHLPRSPSPERNHKPLYQALLPSLLSQVTIVSTSCNLQLS